MKILHINSNYFYTNLYKELINYLDTYNTNTVFSPMIKNAKNIKVKDESAIAPTCFSKKDRFLFYNKQRKIIQALINNLNVNNYSMLHAHTLFTDGNVAYKLFKQYKIPYVVSVRNTDINSFFRKRLLLRNRGKEILENASAVIFLSSRYKQQLLTKYIKSNKMKREINKKSYIIPNGVNDFWFENLYKPKLIDNANLNILNILYVGRVVPNKNLSTTVKSLNILKENNVNVQYNVVGKILDDKLYQKLNTYDFVKFHGELNPQELISLYRSNDIYIMPSIHETFGLVYVEAMTQGLPIIYSKGQGFDGQFEDGVVGYSVDKFDEKDIIKKIELIINKYNEISTNALKLSEDFRWHKIANEYTKVYNSVIRKI